MGNLFHLPSVNAFSKEINGIALLKNTKHLKAKVLSLSTKRDVIN